MLLIKYENDVVPQSSVFLTKWDVRSGGERYSLVSEPSFNVDPGWAG
jgi:hypothetical protein